MIEYIRLKNVGPAPELEATWAPHLNLIAGDNGLGKSFLLDIAWWALTGTWANTVALPSGKGAASIEYSIKGKTRSEEFSSTFKRENATWPLKASRPSMPGIVIYIRVDGSFSVWDPARNYWRNDPNRPPAYHFSAQNVWDGLDVNGQRVCEGLERDWVNWQEGRKPQFTVLKNVLRKLSPMGEELRPGPPQRIFLGEGRERPTLLVGEQIVPITLASAGVRRILALAYFLVWTWFEHEAAAKLMDKVPERRIVVLFDEPETHLHPRWQRTLLPSLLAALDKLRGTRGSQPQLLIATHAPLILASVEAIFNQEQDDLLHLTLVQGRVKLDQGNWSTQGDVSNWLESEVFGLEQARSLEAEQTIDAAQAFMRGEIENLPAGLTTKENIHRALQKLLPADDAFWPRWLIDTDSIKPNKNSKRSKA
jgi:hypothetical protein